MIVLAATLRSKIRALDQRADDALSDPWDEAELLARVRSQLRGRRAEMELRDQARIAIRVSRCANGIPGIGGHGEDDKDAFSLQRLMRYSAFAILEPLVLAVVFLLLNRGERRRQPARLPDHRRFSNDGKPPPRPRRESFPLMLSTRIATTQPASSLCASKSPRRGPPICFPQGPIG